VRYIGLDEIEEAKTEAQRAFRSRENAWQALCLVRLHHREGQPGQCRCSRRLDLCETAQRKGLYHALPHGHPAMLDRHWQP